MWINGERVLIQDYQVGVFAGLQAAKVSLVACRVGAAQGVVAQSRSRVDALAGEPAALRPVTARVLARDGRVEHVHAGNGRDGAIGTESLADAALLIGRKRPHDAAALQAQIALRATRVERDVAGLARGNDVELAQTIDVLRQQILQMLERVMAVRGQTVELCRLLKDIECGMDGAIADNVDAHGVAALGCRQNQFAHALDRNRQTAPVTREARIGIRLGEICRVCTRHAVEELFKAWRREQRVVRVAGLEFFQARLIVEQRGK